MFSWLNKKFKRWYPATVVLWADNSVRNWQTLPISHTKPTSTVSMHITSLVKIHWSLLYLSSGNENPDAAQAENEKEEICPLAIPNQISTISMHLPSLAKIYLHLLKLSGNEKTDGQTYRHTHFRHTDNQLNTIIFLHFRVAGYNKKTVSNLRLKTKMPYLELCLHCISGYTYI